MGGGEGQRHRVCLIPRGTQKREVYLWHFFFLDKDECMTDNNICGFGRCENLPGSYRCVCNRGYTYDDKTKKCVGTKNSDYYFVEVTVV